MAVHQVALAVIAKQLAQRIVAHHAPYFLMIASNFFVVASARDSEP